MWLKNWAFKIKILKNAQMQLASRTLASMHTIDVTSQIFMRKRHRLYFGRIQRVLSDLKKGRIEKRALCG